MNDIEMNKELKLENLVSLRKKMTQNEINTELLLLKEFLDQNNLKKNGSLITATFGIETLDSQQVLDMEILAPVIGKIAEINNSKYVYKPVFHLVNAIYKKHIGNPTLLQNTYNEIIEYMKKNNLQQITAGYNVNISEGSDANPLNNFEIDVYIGVNPSIL